MMILKALPTGFKANVEFQFRLSNAKRHQTLLTYRLDVCNMDVSFKETIFKKWFQSLLEYGNFMPHCPVSPDHYYLNGWKMEPSLVPLYLYPGDYRFTVYGFMGRYKTKTEDFIIELQADAVIS